MEETKAVQRNVDFGFPLLENIVEDLKKLVGGELQNKNQCMHLVNKVEECIQKVKMLAGRCARKNIDVVLTEVLHIVIKVQALLEDCAKEDDWSHVAMTLISNMESYRELLIDLECVFCVMCSIFHKCNPHEKVDDGMGSMDFHPLVGIKLEEDRASLFQWLKDMSQSLTATKDATLYAKYLCKWIECLQKVEGGDVDCMVYPDFPWSCCCLRSLLHKERCKDHPNIHFQHVGESGEVFKTKCLGMDCAVKIVEGFEEQFCMEARVLGGLNHPNITKLIGCGRLNDPPSAIEHGGLEGDVNEEKHFLVMEVLETSLSKLLRTRKRRMPYLVAVEMMLQIARGLCYLHDMKIAHCDMKPDNVLVQMLRYPCLDEELVILKLVDFGLSKINAPRSGPSEFHGPIGTTSYMAPESIASKSGEVTEMNSFSLDVFAFGMMCSEILFGERPFEKEGLMQKKVKEAILGGCRPKLPGDCPRDLLSLIEECWLGEPWMRPTSSSICNQLMEVKKKMMEEGAFEMEFFGNLRTGLFYNFLLQWMKMVGGVLKSQTRAICKKIFALKSIFGVVNDSNTMEGKENSRLQTTNVDIVGIEVEIAKGLEKLQACTTLGLVGMGGIGKTTLARAIWRSIQHEFDGHCFLENLKTQRDNLDVVKNVLRDLGKEYENVRDIQGAKDLLVLALRGKKVLIVLDDINNEQIVALSDLQRLDYGKGSKLIITTRDEDVLEGFEMHMQCMDVSGLGESGAREVFAKYAYEGGKRYLPYIIDIEKKIIEACNGLPLSLEVMGAYLGKEECLRVWERALSRLLRGRTLDVGDRKLWMSLRVSFDNLDNYKKKVFLDISRFFVKGVCPGELARFVAMELWSFGNSVPKQGHAIDVLIKRSLLKVDDMGRLVMHDQLRDMGCNIVEEDAEHMNTRWEGLSMITFDVFSKRGVGNLQGLSFKTCEEYVEGLQNIGEMPSLRIFLIEQCKDLRMIAHILKYSKQIEYFFLGMDDATPLLVNQIFESLAYCKKLCVLKFFCPLLEKLPIACASSSCFASLKILDMRFCSNLAMLPEAFGNLPALETFNMSFCKRLVALPEAFGNLTCLKVLDMSCCERLEAFPETFGNLANLKTLNMSYCDKLLLLPRAFGNLTALEILDMSFCKRLVVLPETFGCLDALETLYMRYCKSLTLLPKAFGNLSSLKTLNMKWCESLAILPKAFGNLSSLETLDISFCKCLIALPKAFGNLSTLKTLNMQRCESLAALLESFGNLASLDSLDLYGCLRLAMLPEAFSNLIGLKTLNMSYCKSLAILPKAFGNLAAFKTLDMSFCISLVVLPDTFGNLAILKGLSINSCENLEALSEAFGNLVALEMLLMRSCKKLAVLPKTFGNLTSLKALDMSFCEKLVALPEAFGNLTNIKTLNMSSCKRLVALPEAFGNLSALETLIMQHCERLTTLPKAFGNLGALESLDMSFCVGLLALPEAFGNLASLKTFNMHCCQSLVALPKAFGNLVALESLDMSFCERLVVLPEAFGNLAALKTLDIRSCEGMRAWQLGFY